MNLKRIIFGLFGCAVLFLSLGSFTVREISSKSIRQVEKRCKIYAIGTGHDTIGDVKVPNLHFEAQGCLNASQALEKFRQVYWEVMTRQMQQSSNPSLKDIVLPNGQSGASIIISFNSKQTGERACLPYARMVHNLHDGRVLVSSMNPRTDQFEDLAETTLAELYGLTSAQPAENQQ